MSQGRPTLPDAWPKPTWSVPEFGVALYLGDCMDVLPLLPANGLDAVVTDPPYGILNGSALVRSAGRVIDRMDGQWNTNRNDDWLALCPAFLPPGGNVAFFHARGDGPTSGAVEPWHRYYWVKPAPPPTPRPVFVSAVEECTIAQRPGPRRWFGTGWEPNYFAGLSPNRLNQSAGHPTEKPLALMTTLVRCLSETGVVDPFAGSGTTGVACVHLGRAFVGIELDQSYFEIAVERIRQAIVDVQAGPLFADHVPRQLELNGVQP